MRSLLLQFACLLVSPCLAQSTCYTNPQGTTLCSNAGSVITGNTDGVGNSVYRDDRGNRLEFNTDAFGNASVQPREGEPIRWSQPVLGEQKYPGSDGRPSPTTVAEPPPVDTLVVPAAGQPLPPVSAPD